MLDLTLDQKQEVMEVLKDRIPKMTKRQLECLVLRLFDFTQTEIGFILDIKQHTVSEHLGNLWDILDNS